MSVSEVTARIAAIQSQLAALAPAGATTGASAFAAQLASAAATSAGGADATTATGATGSGSSATGDAVVASARKYLGVPYVWGGTDPQKGLDCSGLVQRAYADLGIDLPRVSRDQAKVGTAVPSLDQARPGDLLAFGSPVHHIAIYAGDGKMIEAPRPGLDVRVTDVYDKPTAIRRVVDGGVSGVPGVSGVSGAGGVRARTAVAGAVSGVPYADLFNRAGAAHGVSPRLLAAMARQESGFDPRAVSPAGARGLMQLMPATARGLGVTDSLDPAQAVDGAARLMRDLLDRFGGRVDLALAGYNAGPGAVLRYDGVPPYPETKNYVRSILSMVRAA